MTQPTDRPGIDQLRNLADRAERGTLTADEATRLRNGIDTLHIRLWNAEGSSKAWERKADEQQARAKRAEAELAENTGVLQALRRQRDQAEATLTAVRELHQRWDADPASCAHCVDGYGTPVR